MLASNLWVQNPRRLYGKLSKKVHQTLSNRKRNMSEPLRLALETCIIRVFVKEHKPKEKILVKMAEIIDGADTANDILPPLEAYGLEAICIGIRAGCETDLEAIEKSGVVFDGLYEYLKGR